VKLYVLARKGEVCLMAFGAKGDGPATGIITTGASDDTAATQAALNWVGQTGNNLRVPARTFVIDGHLTLLNTQAGDRFDGSVVEGSGWGLNTPGSRFLFTSTGSDPLFTIGREAPPATLPLLMAFTFRDIEFRVAPTTRGSNPLLRIQGAQNWLFDRCYFYGNCDLVDGTWWVGGDFEYCYFRGIAGGKGIVSKNLGWGAGNFVNVVGHRGCTFDQTDVWHDYRIGGRAILFEHCWVEPTAGYDSTASAGFSGDYETTYFKVWCGDADWTGTWITAAGGRVALIECEILQGGIGVVIDTRDTAYVQGGIYASGIENIRIDASRVSVESTRQACSQDGAIGIHVTAGFGVNIKQNSVYASGGATGTVGYKMAAGTRGELIDTFPASPAVATLVENAVTNGGWRVITRTGIMRGTVTTTIGNIAAGASHNFNIVVPGAVASDGVILHPPAGLVDGFIHSAKCATDGTVRVTLFNGSGASAAPAAGSQKWSVECYQSQF
jgi:hypothetical protein